MPSPKPTPKQQDLIARIKTEISAMQGDPECTIDHVGKWFISNANEMGAVFAGRAGRPLLSYAIASLYVIADHNNNDVVLHAHGFWDFLNHRGQPPDIDTIEQFIPAFSLKHHQTFDEQHKLWATFEFNLSQWPSLVPVALASFLSSCGKNPSRATKKYYEENIDLLIQKFYPDDTYAKLQTAVELGLLELSDAELVSWLIRHAHQAKLEAVSTPNDFCV